jgi:hypothetical protein
LYARLQWNSVNGFDQEQFRSFDRGWNSHDWRSYNSASYDQLNWFGLYFYHYNYYYKGDESLDEVVVVGYGTAKKSRASRDMKVAEEAEMSLTAAIVADDSNDKAAPSPPPKAQLVEQKAQQDMSDVKIRTNFNETAFFYPELETDENGEIVIKFTIPEALTRWKMLDLPIQKNCNRGVS